MQAYKSVKNIEIERRNAHRQGKQRGTLTFEVDSNMSAKIITPFTNPFAEVPYMIITPIIDDGHAFETQVAITEITTTNFAVNIQNTSDEKVNGSIQWYTE